MLLTRSFYFLFILCSCVICSCNEQDKLEIEKSASAFDIKQGEASVLQTNQRFIKSFKAKDSVAVANCFTTEAKAMPANQQPVKGRDAITHFVSDLMGSGVSDFKLNTLKIWGDSSILVEEGTYQLLNNKGFQIDMGAYITLWQQEAGNWKIFRDIWTSSVPSSAIKVSQMNIPSH
jgi:ketosteroid isomerase-like protein